MSHPKQELLKRGVEDLEHVVSEMQGTGLTIALDTETTGLIPYVDQITWISWAVSEECFGAFPIQHRNPVTDRTVDLRARSLVRAIVSNPQNTVIWHNGSFDLTMLIAASWFTLDDAEKGSHYDTMLASYVLNPVRRNEGNTHGLKDLYRDILKRANPDWHDQPIFEDVCGELDFRDVPQEKASWYAAFDAWSTLQLYRHYEKEFSSKPLDRQYFRSIALPHLMTTVEIKLAGMSLVEQNEVDKVNAANPTEPALRSIADRKAEYEEIKRKVFELLGEEFNFESPEAMRKALFFGKHGIRPLGRGSRSGKYTLDKGALTDILCEQRNLSTRNCATIAYILYAKQLVDSIKKHEEIYGNVNRKTKKVQPNIAPMTTSGRYWASQPNTLSLSSTSDIKRHIVPRSGNTFVVADFSQIDLRVIANETALQNPDSRMLKDVNDGVDLHLNTLKIVDKRVGKTWKAFYSEKVGTDKKLKGVFHIGVPVPELLDPTRLKELEELKRVRHTVAKPINFGVSYGLGPAKLQENLNDTDEFRDQILYLPKAMSAGGQADETLALNSWILELQTQLKRPNKSLEEVQGYLEEFHRTYPEIKKFQKSVEENLSTQGYCRNIFGRYCPAELIPHMDDTAIDIKAPDGAWYRVWQRRISVDSHGLNCRIKKIARLSVQEPKSKRSPELKDLKFSVDEEIYSVDEAALEGILNQYRTSKDESVLIDDLLRLHQQSWWDAGELLDQMSAACPQDLATRNILTERALFPFGQIPDYWIKRIQVGPEDDRNFVVYPGYDALRRKLISQRVSSTSMDICKIAMIEFRRKVRKEWPNEQQRPQIINCIHDEIAVECSTEIAPRVEEILKSEVMAAAETYRSYLVEPHTMPVKIEAESGVGTNYAKAKP